MGSARREERHKRDRGKPPTTSKSSSKKKKKPSMSSSGTTANTAYYMSMPTAPAEITSIPEQERLRNNGDRDRDNHKTGKDGSSDRGSDAVTDGDSNKFMNRLKDGADSVAEQGCLATMGGLCCACCWPFCCFF